MIHRVFAVAATPRVRRLCLWTVGLVAAYAVIGFLVLPPIVKSQLQKQLSQALHREATVQAVRVNPFAPSLTVRGLAVRERTGEAVFAGFEELYVNVAAWASLLRLAPVVDEMTLSGPRLRVVRNADRTYNFQDLVDEAPARRSAEASTDSAPPKLALFNLRLLDGRIEFDDRAEGRTHTVTELRVGIPFVSSLPADVEVKVLPELSARVNEAPLHLGGEMLPFGETRTTLVNLELDGFDLTRLTEYLPFKPRAQLRSALLDAQLAVLFDQPPGGTPRLRVRGSTALRNVAVDAEDGPVAAWKRLGVELHEVEPLARRVHLGRVELEAATLHLRRDKEGGLNLAKLGPADAAAGESSSPPFALKIDSVALDLAELRFRDETTTPAFEARLTEARLEGSDFDLARDARSKWTFAAGTDAGETIRVEAAATIEPLSVEGRVDLRGVPLKRYQPYVDQAANVRIDEGQVDLGVGFAFAGQALKLADVGLAARALRARLPDEKKPFLEVASVQIAHGEADLAARLASLGEVSVSGLKLGLQRRADGALNVARIAREGQGGQPGEDKPWRIDLPAASLAAAAVTFEDLGSGEPVRVSIAPLELKAERLSTARGERGNVLLRATIDKSGHLVASGPVSLDPLAARLDIDARNIGFAPAQPYIDDKVHLAVTSGALSAKGMASIELAPGAPLKASYRGQLAVTNFASIDKRLTQDLLKWKSLTLRAIDFDLEPLKVSVDEIALADYYARIILSADGRLNLQDLVAADGEAPAREAPAREARARPQVRIGKIALRGGNVNFSDFFVKPNYSANLTGIGGTVTEMRPDKAGEVDLRGSIDNAAPLEIVGRVNPLGPELFLDMSATARDIELPPLSPYAVKYAGYGIERGKLSLGAKYHIEERSLTAENQIYLDQLTFGQPVESPTATKLPVTLAIALLKDRNGVIDINLPISGSLDDPQFSLGGLIARALVNLIVKAVTSPFALLGALVGGGEELSYVEFAPGSALLGEAAQRKLQSLARALTDRPGLRLDIAGRVAPEEDREALKRAFLARKVRAQKFADLRRVASAPASPDAVVVAPEEYEKYLRRAYGAEKFDKPRNALGFAKELPVPEMEKLMLANTSVAEDDLRLLANARAQAAKEWLVTQGQIPAERVFLVAPKLGADDLKDKGPPMRADFGLR